MLYQMRPLTPKNVFGRVPVVNSQQLDSKRPSMPHPRLALSILLLSAVAHSAASGQTIPSPYRFIQHSQEVGFYAGLTNMDPGQLGLGPRDATAYGLRYGVAFSGAAALDVYAVYYDSSRDVLDVSRPEDDRVVGRSNFAAIMADVRLRINMTGQRTWHGLQPYFMFGGGIAGTASTDRLLENLHDISRDEWFEFGPTFMGVFGLGTNYHLSDKFSLRLEGDWKLYKVHAPIGWLTLEADPLSENPASEWVSAKSITLGAAWRF